MAKTKVGKETSVSGEVYSRTYQKLLRQRERIDREILKLQGKFFKSIAKQTGTSGRKYVPRLHNLSTLVEAIRSCMTPGRHMTMADILAALEKKNLYNTNSKYFYTMVNNKLNVDKDIEKVSRGVFVYNPTKRKTGHKGKKNAIA